MESHSETQVLPFHSEPESINSVICTHPILLSLKADKESLDSNNIKKSEIQVQNKTTQEITSKPTDQDEGINQGNLNNEEFKEELKEGDTTGLVEAQNHTKQEGAFKSTSSSVEEVNHGSNHEEFKGERKEEEDAKLLNDIEGGLQQNISPSDIAAPGVPFKLQDNKKEESTLLNTHSCPYYLKDYKTILFLGKGSQGPAYMAQDKKGQICAIKIFPKKNGKNKFNYNAEELYTLEASIISKQKDMPSSLYRKSGIDQSDDCYILSMKLGAGTLKDLRKYLIEKKSRLPDQCLLFFLTHLLKQINNLNSIGFVHRDIKLANIVISLSESHMPQIIDFGFAYCFETTEIISEWAGTEGYIDPNIYKNYHRGLSKEELIRGDLFSMGIVLLGLANLEYSLIHGGLNLKEELSGLKNRPKIYEALHKLLFPKDFHPEYVKELIQLLEKENDSNNEWINQHFEDFLQYLQGKGKFSELALSNIVLGEERMIPAKILPDIGEYYFELSKNTIQGYRRKPNSKYLELVEKALKKFKEAKAPEKELVCYENIIKHCLQTNKLESCDGYVIKCEQMAINEKVKCHSLLFSTLGLYYLEKDRTKANKMFSIGLERAKDDLSRLILLSNRGHLGERNNSNKYDSDLQNAYRIIEDKFSKYLNPVLLNCSIPIIKNSDQLQCYPIDENRNYEILLSSSDIAIDIGIEERSPLKLCIGKAEEGVVLTVFLNFCVDKAFCIENMLKGQKDTTLLEKIKTFCLHCNLFNDQVKVQPLFINMFMNLAKFAETIGTWPKNAGSFEYQSLDNFINQIDSLNNKTKRREFYHQSRKKKLMLAIDELEYKELFCVMIGFALIYWDPSHRESTIEKNIEMQVLLDKLKFPLEFRNSVEIESYALHQRKVKTSIDLNIPEFLHKFIAYYKFQVEQEEVEPSTIQYKWELTSLHLIIEDMCDPKIEELTKYIQKVQDLKELSLRFGVCPDLAGLSEVLLKLDILESLFLHFDSSSKVKDHQLKQITEIIASYTNLKHLEVKIEDGFMTKNGIDFFKDAIEKTVNLEVISFFLTWCPNVTTMSIVHLVSIIKNLPSVRDLTMNFESCVKISIEAMKKIEEHLRETELLKTAKISVRPC